MNSPYGYQTIIPDIISLKYLNTAQNKKDQNHFTGKVPPFPQMRTNRLNNLPLVGPRKDYWFGLRNNLYCMPSPLFLFLLRKKMFFTLIQTKSVSTDIFVFYFFTFFKEYFYFFELKSL